jgi:signal peptidase
MEKTIVKAKQLIHSGWWLRILIAVIALLAFATLITYPNGWRLLVVQSGSMLPEIKTGSIVLSIPRPYYQVNEIITFQQKDQLVTHRLIEVTQREGQTWFQTKGDANDAADLEKVRPDQVVGKVVFSISGIGYVINLIKNPLGWALFIIAPATLLIYHELQTIWQEIKRLGKRSTKETKKHPTAPNIGIINILSPD